jgi:hypothetical protein
MPSSFAILLFGLTGFSCFNEGPSSLPVTENKTEKDTTSMNKPGIRTVHVFVALCDNLYQRIKAIGNGQDPSNNLFWGCDNGLKTYFRKKTSDWMLVQTQTKISDTILERLLFKHKTQNVYLLAEAYSGKFIKQTTIDFLKAAAGRNSHEAIYKEDNLYFGGSSNLLAYIGHDGLMDFSLPLPKHAVSIHKREVIILACYSQYYFSPHIRNCGAIPLLWSTNLMAPEAYTLHDALPEWIAGRSKEEIGMAAAKAYPKFQNCSIRAAGKLLVSGW